jgi:type II secretory ATPase GspE/PulE/Tfp pilus assembly ATPase PilB-like protein
VLVSAPPRQGLTTILYSILRAHDAFLNHIQTIERVAREDLEGITQTKMGAGASAAEEQKQVDWVTSQQPEIVMIDDVINPQSARTLLNFAGDAENKRVYVGMRSGSTFEAIESWRKLVGDDALALKTVGLVISGRVLRKLCMACKVAYSPDPDTLRKLNMDPDRVDKLYQARTSPLTDQKGRPIPCEFCQDLRYKGRLGVFELFVIDDEVRKAIVAGASTKQLQTIFRKHRGKFLQEQALALVEAGDTSVQEVLRVLKGKNEPPQQSPPGAGAMAAIR